MLDAPEDYVLVGEETTDALVTEPKKLYIRRNRRRKYALKATLQQAEDDRKAMVIAPWPKEVVFPGCFAEVSTLANLEVQKFFYHMPHYRVIQQYKEAGSHGEQFDHQLLAQPKVRFAPSSVQCLVTASDEVSLYTL